MPEDEWKHVERDDKGRVKELRTVERTTGYRADKTPERVYYERGQNVRGNPNIKRTNINRVNVKVKQQRKQYPIRNDGIGGKKQINSRLNRLQNAFKTVKTDPFRNVNWDARIKDINRMNFTGPPLRKHRCMTGKYTINSCLPKMKKYKFKL
jgi:hypothetical protein